MFMNEAVINSKQNKRIKQWRKLLTVKGRNQQGSYLIEGFHLIQEAVLHHQSILDWVMTPDYYERLKSEASPVLPSIAQITFVTEEVARALSATEQPQGIFAVVALPKSDVSWTANGQRYLLIDAVQDPGNLGTMIRTADAAGYDGVIIGEGTVDLYNDKVLRSTQGSLWHLEIVRMNLKLAIQHLQDRGISVLATALHREAKSYREVEQGEKIGLIVGNEGQGVAQQWIEMADKRVFIPMPGQAESLNVAIAAGILMFHFN